MFRSISSIALSSLLILSLTSSPSSAQMPNPGDTLPGADLFQKAWKSDQGLGTPINIPEAIRLRFAANATEFRSINTSIASPAYILNFQP